MSLMTAVSRVPSYLAEQVARLIVDIVTNANPGAAIKRAQKAVIADAADAATEEAAKKILGKTRG